MKKVLLIILILLLILIGMFAPREYKSVELETKDGENTIRIMSYNIKNSYQDYEGWIDRRHALIDQIRLIKPDVLALQEADENWMEFLRDELDEYIILGEGRLGSGMDEHTPILYLADRFELLDSGTFWLSEMPENISKGWDGACHRICTFAKLKDLKTGQVFVHYNTHLDHEGKEARTKGAELILEKLSKQDHPVFLTGDFNLLEKSKVYDSILDSGLNDVKYIAEDSMAFGTINYFINFHFRFVPPIDFIFASDQVTVQSYKVHYQYRYNNQPVSDHYAIYSDVNL